MSSPTPPRFNRQILSLALPNILSNITVPLLGIADLALAGRLNDVDAIGGIAIASTIFNLIYWNFAFLRMGTTGMTAQAKGAGDTRLTGRLLSQALILGLLFGTIVFLMRFPLLSVMMQLLSPSDSIISYCIQYFDIVIYAAPAVLCTFALNGWIIGMQNTWLPMTVSILTNALNIGISAYLVLSAGWGIKGIATGTLVAHYVGVALLSIGAYVLYVRSRQALLPSRMSALGEDLGRFFRTNADIFLRTFLLILVTGFFTYAGTQMGSLILSTNTLLLQFFTIFSYFSDGFAYAAEAMVGLYYGQRKRAYIKTSIHYLFLWCIGITIAATLLYVLGSQTFLRALTDKSELIAYAQPYLVWVYLIPAAGFLAFLWDGIYIGLTATREMLWSMLAAVAIFFSLYGGIQTEDPNHSLWIAFLGYLLIRGLMQTLLARRIEGLGRPITDEYYLSVGTDNPSPSHLHDLRLLLRTTWPQCRISKDYITPDATGKTSKIYANSVVYLKSPLPLEGLTELTKQLEVQMGRTPSSSSVPLDIDIVVQNQTILRPKDYSRDYFRIGYNALGGTDLSV